MFKRGTDNFNLPQWDFDEHPDFLDDINPAYKTIDDNLHIAKSDSADALKQLGTITPIVDGLTDDVDIAKHDITDLQTRCTNLEHFETNASDRLTALELHDDDLDATLTGYDKTHTVYKDVDNLRNQIDDIEAKDVYLFDGVARDTNKKVGDTVVKRKCTKTTVIMSEEGNKSVEVMDSIPTGSTIFAINTIAVGSNAESVLDKTTYVDGKLYVDYVSTGDNQTFVIYATVEYLEEGI